MSASLIQKADTKQNHTPGNGQKCNKAEVLLFWDEKPWRLLVSLTCTKNSRGLRRFLCFHDGVFIKLSPKMLKTFISHHPISTSTGGFPWRPPQRNGRCWGQIRSWRPPSHPGFLCLRSGPAQRCPWSDPQRPNRKVRVVKTFKSINKLLIGLSAEIHLLNVDSVQRWGLHVAHPEGPGQLLGLLPGDLAQGLQVALVADQQKDDVVGLDVALGLLQPVVDVLEGPAVCDVEEQEAAHRVLIVRSSDRPAHADTPYLGSFIQR